MPRSIDRRSRSSNIVSHVISPSSRAITAFASVRPTVANGLAAELDPDPARAGRRVKLLAETMQLVTPRRQLLATVRC